MRLEMRVVEAQTAEHEFLMAVGLEFLDEAGGRALRRRGGIVQLVGQVAGQLAQSIQLLGLLLQAGHLADAIEQDGDAALRHGGDGRQHLGKHFAIDLQAPDVGGGKAVAAEGLHAGEGQQRR